MDKLTVVALMKAKPGKEEILKAELLALIEPTRREAGCINYDLHESTVEPGSFMFHENWKSQKDLEDHLAKPHLQAFLGKAGELLACPPEILQFSKIG